MIYEKSIRTIADAVVADSCLFHLIGEQSAGDMRNLKPTGNPAVKDATFTDGEAWANKGYMTTGADTTAFAQLPLADSQFTLVNRSLIVYFRIKKATPAGTEIFIGSTDSGGTPGGFTIDGRNTAQARLTVFANDGTNAGISLAGVCDGSEHSVCVFVPYDGSSFRSYVDGVFLNTASAANVAGKDCAGTGSVRVGSAFGTNGGKAANIAELALYNPAKTLSELPQALIADYLYRNPGMPLEAWHL